MSGVDGRGSRGRPRVELALVAPVPGVLVRLAPAVLLLLCGVLSGGGALLWAVLVPAAIGVAWQPASPAPAVSVALIGVAVFAGGDGLGGGAGPTSAGLARTSALVLGVHLVLRGAALASHVSWRSAVEGRVLARVARSVLGVQIVAQSVVLAVVWLRGGLGGVVAGAPWLRLVAVAAVLSAALLVVPPSWLRRRPRAPTWD